MSSTKVFRVQDAEGRGPWRPGFGYRWEGPYRPDLENLKPPWVEFGPGLFAQMVLAEHYGSGCLTQEQLRRWFTEPEYRRLIGLGFQAVELDADRIIAASKIQCFFARWKPLATGAEPFALY